MEPYEGDGGGLPGPATAEDPFKGRDAIASRGGDWRAFCPKCGEEVARVPPEARDLDDPPWLAAQDRRLSFGERDYYCKACGAFTNLKDVDVWHRGSRN